MFALTSIMIGILLLLFSLKPASQICRSDKLVGWKVLAMLLIGFVGGYVGFLLYILLSDEPIDSVTVSLSLILLGGAVFVAVIVPLSLKSILKINKVAEEERHSALHDSLTGLPNRKYLLEHIQSQIAQRSQFVLVLMDLNNFKQINDGLGHFFGDKFLISVAHRLQHGVLPFGQLYRLGGDEFALVFQQNGERDIQSLIDQVHNLLQTPITVLDYKMNTSASIGISRYPDNSQDVFGLLKQSDLAMYESKKKSMRYSFYREDLGNESYEKLKLSLKLSDAVNNNEFQLYYQPIIDAATGKVASLEALLRWPQLDGSFIGPDKFIPVAEKSALITRISSWVVEQAIQDLQFLRHSGFNGRISINLSAKDLQCDDIVDQLKTALAAQQIKPDELRFEITEGAMLEDLAKTKLVMRRINMMGFSFSVDDFGTGYSSLILLRELPIEEIKIDRSFVLNLLQNETDRLIVHSVINLAKVLNCTLVAEGVENQPLADELKQLGCDYLQGYLFSKPLPLDTIISERLVVSEFIH
jgi:diguanylate cyclase